MLWNVIWEVWTDILAVLNDMLVVWGYFLAGRGHFPSCLRLLKASLCNIFWNIWWLLQGLSGTLEEQLKIMLVVYWVNFLICTAFPVDKISVVQKRYTNTALVGVCYLPNFFVVVSGLFCKCVWVSVFFCSNCNRCSANWQSLIFAAW